MKERYAELRHGGDLVLNEDPRADRADDELIELLFAGGVRVAARVNARNVHALPRENATIEHRARERRARAARFDTLTFAEVTAAADAGQTLQRPGEILVANLAHVFRGDGQGEADVFALCRQR